MIVLYNKTESHTLIRNPEAPLIIGFFHLSLKKIILKENSLLIFQEDISAIFTKADKDNSGTLTVKEFQEVIADICERYPQVELYLKNKQMGDIIDLLREAKGDVAKESIELNIEEFKSALSQVDSQMKNLPATAQVLTTSVTFSPLEISMSLI